VDSGQRATIGKNWLGRRNGGHAIFHHGRLDPGVLLLAKPYSKAEIARMIRHALTAA